MLNVNRLVWLIITPWIAIEMRFWGELLGGVAGALIGGSSKAAKASAKASKAQAKLYNTQAKISKQQWGHYLETYAPLERELAASAREGVSADYSGVTSRASADVVQAFEKARETTNRNLGRRGINPNSGAAIAASTGVNIDQAAAEAGAINAARTGERRYVDDTNFARRFAVSNLGRGLPGQALNGLSSAASQAGNSALINGRAAAGISNFVSGLPWDQLFTSNGGAGAGVPPSQGSVLPTQRGMPTAATVYNPNAGGFGVRPDYGATSWGGSYYDGGEIAPVERGLPMGPGTGMKEVVGGDGTPDSVPGAVRTMEGEYLPAAFDEGEVVVPRDVVEWKGKEFFNKLNNSVPGRGLPTARQQ